jgi:hypothetical protein
METPARLGPPPDEILYCTLEAAKSALQNHPRENGSRALRTVPKVANTEILVSQNAKKNKLNEDGLMLVCTCKEMPDNCRTKQQSQSWSNFSIVRPTTTQDCG